MSNVEFDEERSAGHGFTETSERKVSSFVQLIIKAGITKSETVATYILLGIAIIFLIASFFLFSQANKAPNVENNPDLHLDYV